MQASLNLPPQSFLKRLNGWSQYAEKEITKDNILEHLTDPIIFEHAAHVDLDLTDHLFKTMIEVLNSLNANEWEDAFRNVDSFLFKVTRYLLDADKLDRLPDDAVAVYKRLLIEVAKDEFQMNEDDGWQVFYRRADKRRLRPTAKNIRDIYLSQC